MCVCVCDEFYSCSAGFVCWPGRGYVKVNPANFILGLIWLRFEFIQTDMIPFLCFLCMTPDRSLDSPQTRQSVSVSCSHSGSLSLSFASLVVFIHFIIFFNSFVLVEVFLVNTEPGVVREQSYKGARWTLLLLTLRRSEGGFFLLGFFVTTCCWAEVKSVQRVTWTDGRVELDCVLLEVY